MSMRRSDQASRSSSDANPPIGATFTLCRFATTASTLATCPSDIVIVGSPPLSTKGVGSSPSSTRSKLAASCAGARNSYASGLQSSTPASADALVYPHRQALQPQFADRAAIERREVRVDHMRLREARQQPLDRDGDGGAAEDVADAVMWAGAERQDALRLA